MKRNGLSLQGLFGCNLDLWKGLHGSALSVIPFV